MPQPVEPQQDIYSFLEEKLQWVTIFRCDLGNAGAFGRVFIGKENGDFSRYLAVKLVRPPSNQRHLLKIEREALQRYCRNLTGNTHLINVLRVLPPADERTKDYLIYTMDLADNASTGGHVHSDDEINGYEADTLLRRFDNRAFTLAEIDQLVRSILHGLAALEQQGLVHRDIKPENLFFVNGNIVLGDVGTLVTAGVSTPCLGSPIYMAPEKWKLSLAGQEAKFQCSDDLYQLGAVIYLLGLEPTARKNFMFKQKEETKKKRPLPRRDGLKGYAGGLTTREARLLNRFLNIGWGTETFPVGRCACADKPANRFQNVEQFRDAWKMMMYAAREPRRVWKWLAGGAGVLLLAVMVALLSVQVFIAHRNKGLTEQENARHELHRWLLTHPPLASFAWERPWERVPLGDGTPDFDPLGGWLDPAQWTAEPKDATGKLRATMPPQKSKSSIRTLQLVWHGQPLRPEFEVQFLLFAEPPKCGLTIELTPDKPAAKPVSFHFAVTHAGFFEAPEDAREEGEIYEHGVRLIWSGQEVLVVADSIQVGALRQLPDDWENIDWRLSLRLDANAPGEVSLRHLLFFKPVEK